MMAWAGSAGVGVDQPYTLPSRSTSQTYARFSIGDVGDILYERVPATTPFSLTSDAPELRLVAPGRRAGARRAR